jgi:hypothetical protein
VPALLAAMGVSTAAGHFGNLSRLRAAAPWRRMLAARLS